MRVNRILLTVFVLGLLSACSRYVIKTDTAPQADFTHYKTFAFSRLLSPQEAPVEFNQINQERVRGAIQRELAARRYTSNTTPDLLVSTYLRVAEKQRVISDGGYYGGPYYRGAYSGYNHDWVRTVDYKEGTLIIDLVDTKANRLVWQGVANGIMSDKPDKVEERINQVIADIFKKFPFTAP